MRGVDKAPTIVNVTLVIQPGHGSCPVYFNAVIDFTHLLSNMDVDRGSFKHGSRRLDG